MVEPKTGILLIAEPFLKEPHFMRSVILMCEHQQAGSVGFVLNKPYHQTLDELVNNFEGFHIPVFYGGPVQVNSLHFIHQYPDEIPGSVEIIKGVYWGGDFEILSSLIKNNVIDINKIRLFIGYSGWGSGQLENELLEKTWLTVDAKPELIFQSNADQIWKQSLKHLGGNYEMMAHYPIDPQLN